MILARRKDSDSGTPRAPSKTRSSLSQLVSYVLGAWRLLIILLVCVVTTSLLELAVPWVMGFFLIDRVVKQGDLSLLPHVAVLLTGIFLAQRVFSFLQDYFYELANQRIIHRLRCDLFEHVEGLPLRFFERGRTGELLARLTGDVDTVEGLLGTLMQDIATEFVVLVGALSFLYAVNPRLTGFILPTIVVLAFSVFFFKRTVKRFARRVRDLLGEMAALAGETIAGVRVVKAFCGEKFEAAAFAAKSFELLRARVNAAKLQSVYSSTVDVCVFAGTLIVVLVATPWVVAGSFTVGALVAYLSYLGKLYGPVKKLSKVNLSIQKILAAGDRILEVMNEPPEGAAEIKREKRAAARSIQPVTRMAGAVEFEGVSFGYEPDRLVLRDFNLRAAPGEVIALVGHSGGGKTTVVNLLLRFYHPTAGRVLIDGVPLELVPLHQLRRQIGLVQQETFLFSGTIRDNIAYASPEATDGQIMEAAHAAYAHDFISQLPGSYLSEVGERGVKLSGGQRQRIAIARALLRDPRIVIFDEATSHLDSESEQIVQQALERVARGRTVFVVAHRLSTVWRADKIAVIEEGGIAEIGTHEELLASNGIYRRLYALQLSPLNHQTAEAPAAG